MTTTDIAYLRRWADESPVFESDAAKIRAVCALAERGLLTDAETETVQRWVRGDDGDIIHDRVVAILRRLLPDVPADQLARLLAAVEQMVDTPFGSESYFELCAAWRAYNEPT